MLHLFFFFLHHSMIVKVALDPAVHWSQLLRFFGTHATVVQFINHPTTPTRKGRCVMSMSIFGLNV